MVFGVWIVQLMARYKFSAGAICSGDTCKICCFFIRAINLLVPSVNLSVAISRYFLTSGEDFRRVSGMPSA